MTRCEDLAGSLKSWQGELTSGEENLGMVNIGQGIFQGDSLSLLLFAVCLLPFTHLYKRFCTRISFYKQQTKS